MEKCIICNKEFEDNFALMGHIRLSSDIKHRQYYSEVTKNPKQLVSNPEIEIKNIIENIRDKAKTNQELKKVLLDVDKIKQDEINQIFMQGFKNAEKQAQEYIKNLTIMHKRELNRAYNQGFFDCNKNKNRVMICPYCNKKIGVY